MKRLLILIALIVFFFVGLGQIIASGQIMALGQIIASGQIMAFGQSKKTCQHPPTYFGIAGLTN